MAIDSNQTPAASPDTKDRFFLFRVQESIGTVQSWPLCASEQWRSLRESEYLVVLHNLVFPDFRIPVSAASE